MSEMVIFGEVLIKLVRFRSEKNLILKDSLPSVIWSWMVVFTSFPVPLESITIFPCNGVVKSACSIPFPTIS